MGEDMGGLLHLDGIVEAIILHCYLSCMNKFNNIVVIVQ